MSKNGNDNQAALSRRQVMTGVTAGVAGAALAASAPRIASAGPFSPKVSKPMQKGHNILFVFTDQERFMPKWPSRLNLPAHERLHKKGTTFLNHYIGAVMCTSSRAIMMTGLTTPDNLM